MRETHTVNVVIQEKGVIGLCGERLPAIREGDVHVETIYSGISAGTELTSYQGTNPKLTLGWDEQRCMFRGDIPPNTQDAFPKHEGYMPSGVVTESRNHALPEGTLVAGQYNHKSRHTAGPNEHLIPLPAGFDPLLGIWAGKFGPICMNGILVAADEITRKDNLQTLEGTLAGRRVAILGAGMVGLFTGRLAQWAGAEDVAIVDLATQNKRLSAAKQLGMTPVAVHPDLAIELKDRWRSTPEDTGADIFFQCTGSSAVLSLGFKILRREGLGVDMGFYQGGAPEVHYGEEFHHNQLIHRCAQIGAMPRHQAGRWNRRALAHASVEFLQDHGKPLKESTVTDIVPFSRAPEIFTRLASRDPNILQAVLEPDTAAYDGQANL